MGDEAGTTTHVLETAAARWESPPFTGRASTAQLPLQRRPEAGRDPYVPYPPRQPRRLGLHRRRGLASALVRQQPPGDLAVRALGPAADDPAVPPHRGADVAAAVEETGD